MQNCSRVLEATFDLSLEQRPRPREVIGGKTDSTTRYIEPALFDFGRTQAGSDFYDKALRRIYGGFGKTRYQNRTVSRPIPNETPTKYTFLKSSHRALSNGAIYIAIPDDPNPITPRSKSLLI